MGTVTGITWCDHTFNPWLGCTEVSAACDHCYARVMMQDRYHRVEWGNHPRRRTSANNWGDPLRWHAAAQAAGRRTRAFCASLADVFDNQVDPAWRADLWRLIAATPWLDWQLLTKRPQNVRKMLPPDWGDGYPNVWLGTTVENQAEADRRIPHLLAVPATVKFLSLEPLLGPVDLSGFLWWKGSTGLQWALPPTARRWVIAGGESGPGARPTNPDWLRSLRDQCAEADVPFFFKQWGEWVDPWQLGAAHWQHVGAVDDPAYGHGRLYETADSTVPMFGGRIFPAALPFGPCPHAMMVRTGKALAGALLDGVAHLAFPA